MICSMSRKGNCWDNAPTESWINSFKNERIHGLRYETRADMATMSFEYIEVLYNRKRQHSTLGYKSPMRFLNDWLSSTEEKADSIKLFTHWKTKNRANLRNKKNRRGAGLLGAGNT